MITTVNLNQKDYEKLKKILEKRGNTFKWWITKKIKEEIEKNELKNPKSDNI